MDAAAGFKLLGLLTDSLTHRLTVAICRGVFTPKNQERLDLTVLEDTAMVSFLHNKITNWNV